MKYLRKITSLSKAWRLFGAMAGFLAYSHILSAEIPDAPSEPKISKGFAKHLDFDDYERIRDLVLRIQFEFSNEEFHHIHIGRSLAPLSAFMLARDPSSVSMVPLSSVGPEIMEAAPLERKNLFDRFDAYLPSPAQMAGRTYLLSDILVRTSVSLLWVHRIFEEYLNERRPGSQVRSLGLVSGNLDTDLALAQIAYLVNESQKDFHILVQRDSRLQNLLASEQLKRYARHTKLPWYRSTGPGDNSQNFTQLLAFMAYHQARDLNLLNIAKSDPMPKHLEEIGVNLKKCPDLMAKLAASGKKHYVEII